MMAATHYCDPIGRRNTRTSHTHMHRQAPNPLLTMVLQVAFSAGTLESPSMRDIDFMDDVRHCPRRLRCGTSRPVQPFPDLYKSAVSIY